MTARKMLPALFAALLFPAALTAETPSVANGDYLVPAIVSAPGKNGANFRSELIIANPGDSDVELEGLYVEPEPHPPFLLRVAARSVRLFGSKELLEAAGFSEAALPLRLRGTSGASTVLPMTLQVFNALPEGGTYGLSFPVERASQSVLAEQETAYFVSGALDVPERLNISLLAPFDAATARLEIVTPFGMLQKTITAELKPRERKQFNDILAGSEFGSRVHLTVTSGRIQAYGTMVSNSNTNDPYRAPVLRTSSVSQRWTVPAVAETAGLLGSFFSSDLFLVTLPNTHDRQPLINVTFRARDGSPPVTKTVMTLMGSTRIVFHVLAELFPEAKEKAGVLELASDEISSQWKYLAFSVTRSSPETGPSSQDQPCVPEGEEITSSNPAAIAGLVETQDFRSNLLLYNAGNAGTVKLTLLTQTGPGGTVEVPMKANEIRQWNSVAKEFSHHSLGAGTLLIAPSAGMALTASAARIDNRTNDPAGLPVTKTSP